jgi:hypothetical protein
MSRQATFDGQGNVINRTLAALAEKVQVLSMGFDDGRGDGKSHIDFLNEMALVAPDASMNGMNCIKFEIQFQHIHSRFAQESQLAPFHMFSHETTNV